MFARSEPVKANPPRAVTVAATVCCLEVDPMPTVIYAFVYCYGARRVKAYTTEAKKSTVFSDVTSMSVSFLQLSPAALRLNIHPNCKASSHSNAMINPPKSMISIVSKQSHDCLSIR